jgi:protein O-mannosyl-transferase
MTSTEATLEQPSTSRHSTAMLTFGLLVLTMAAYLPAFNAGFIWDDDSYVTDNLTLSQPGGLKRIWTEFEATPQYYPMVFTTFWIETRLWGNGGSSAAGFHALNILLHAVGAILLWRLLTRLKIPGAWLAGLLFAVHPVQVESVAWITERKNTLSLVFYLSAAIQWLKWNLDQGSSKNYAAAAIFFVAALLSKSVTCSLPAALLLVVWLKTGQITRRDLKGALPFFAIGIAAASITVWLESGQVGAAKVQWNLSVFDRFIIAGRVIWFYSFKLLWPNPLIFIYPKWSVDGSVWWQWLFPLSALAVPVFLYVRRERFGRGPLVACLFFGGTLFPALGFINVYPFRFSYVADHFQYLASLGLITLAAAGLSKLITKYSDVQLPKTTLSFVVILLVAISFNRCFAYRDLRTLWRDTLIQNPSSQLANTNMAAMLMADGKVELAEPLLREAIKQDPTFHGAHLRLGIITLNRGDFVQAAKHLKKTVKIAPDDFRGHLHLGRLWLAQEEYARAETTLDRAHKLSPNSAEVVVELAFVSQVQGRYDKALKLFELALSLEPKVSVIWFNTGVLLAEMERPRDAIDAYKRTIKLNPADVYAHYNLGNTYAQQSQLQSAIKHYRAALDIEPRFEQAAQNLRAALDELKQR